MFSMIFASGAAIFRRSVPLTQRSLVILAIAVGLGLGVELRPEALQHLPEGVRNFIGTGLITGGLTALLLNAILPDPAPDD
jgi:NCS2 family nucleobase:cation symporter-2